MIPKKQLYPFVMIMMVLLPLLFTGLQACSGNGHEHSQVGETVVMPESQVVGRFLEFRGPSPSGIYEMDIEIIESHDIEGAENPTKDKVGKRITAFTLEGEYAVLPGEIIAAYVSLYEENGSSYLFARNLYPAILEEK